MKHNPLITIYIINKNYGKYINQAFKSVIEQNYKNIELIIIDDKSNDNSKQKIVQLEKKFKKIKVFFNNKSKGLIKNINFAIRNCSGKYILRLDADDILRYNSIKLLFNEIKKNSKIKMVFSDFYLFKKNTKYSKKISYNYPKMCSYKYEPAHGACSLINVNYLRSINGYSEKYMRQDGFYIWFKILISGYKIRYLKKNLFYYRQHKNNMSKNKYLILKSRIQILNDFMKSKNKYKAYFNKSKKILENKIKLI